MIINKPPGFKKDAFNCPYCSAYAHQYWEHYTYSSGQVNVSISEQSRAKRIPTTPLPDPDLSLSYCSNCYKHSVWVEGNIIYPTTSSAPMPVENMPGEVLVDYNEARLIFEKSPRASAALLRLSIQKLCKHLGGKGNNINKDIGFLVEKGLPDKIQKALDVVRVVGNNAVHPGEININDNPEVALLLFKMVNLIVDTMITQPLEIDAVYNSLPEGSRIQIETRDSGSK